MDLELVEPHPRLVLEAFRRGEFDGLEVLGQADEKAFFELCFREKLLDALAAAMPDTSRVARDSLYSWLDARTGEHLLIGGADLLAAIIVTRTVSASDESTCALS